MSDHPALTTVFLSNPGLYRHYQCADANLWVYDRSSIPFLIEELIAHAAVEVLLPTHSMAAKAISELSPLIADRVRLVDPKGQLLETVSGVLSPLYDELGYMVSKHDTLPRSRDKQPVDRETLDAARTLHQELYGFLAGSHLQAQVAVDFERFRAAITTLRSIVRSPDARACLAVLAGITESYSITSVPAVCLKPSATAELAYRFRMFVEDQVYRELSADSRGLGIPGQLSRAKQMMARRLRDLANSPLLRGLFGVGAAGVTVATGATMRDEKVMRDFLPTGYLPPILSLSEMDARAQSLWNRTELNVEAAFRSIDLKPEDSDFFSFFRAPYWRPMEATFSTDSAKANWKWRNAYFYDGSEDLGRNAVCV